MRLIRVLIWRFRHSGKPFVEVANDVEDEGSVGDWFAEVAGVLRLPLVEPAVIGDRKIALTEIAEVRIGEEGARRLISEELGLDGEPDGAGGGAALGDIESTLCKRSFISSSCFSNSSFLETLKTSTVTCTLRNRSNNA